MWMETWRSAGDATSVFNGSVLEIEIYDNSDDESAAVGEWLKDKSAIV